MSLIQEHERSLELFLEEGLITEIVAEINSGKEATIFLCRANASLGYEHVVAKVYRAHIHRSFRHDADYLEGMFPTAKDSRAVVRKSNFKGRTLKAGSWVEREYRLLEELHEIGVPIPRVIEKSFDTILMEFVGSDEGPAPILKHVRPDRETARRLFHQVMGSIEMLLSHHCVHADLSEYNILCDGRDAWLIDFPQAVDCRFNSNAERFLTRDIDRVCRYFARFGVDESPELLAMELWERYAWGEL